MPNSKNVTYKNSTTEIAPCVDIESYTNTCTTHCLCTSISTSYPQPEGHMTKCHMSLWSESVRSVRETCWDKICNNITMRPAISFKVAHQPI